MSKEDNDDFDDSDDQPEVTTKVAAVKPGKAGKAAKQARAAKSQTPQEKMESDPDFAAYVKLSGGTIRKTDGTFAGKGEKLFGGEPPVTESVAAGDLPDPMASPEPMAKPEPTKKVSAKSAASAEEREKFLGLARRFKVPTPAAEAAMAGDRDALLAWTADLDTMQARFDELSGRSGDAKGAPKDQPQEPKAGTPKAVAKGAPARSEPGSDIREQLVEMAAAEGLSEEFADKLLAIVKPDSDLKALAESVRSLHEKQARTALLKEFKGLADTKAYASVRARVARWIANGVYEPDQVEDAMRDSCKIEFHGQSTAKDEEEDDVPDARDEGSPTAPKRGSKTTVTSGDREYDAYVNLTRGASPKEVRSRLTR